jgi:hypothetical protein
MLKGKLCEKLDRAKSEVFRQKIKVILFNPEVA